MHILLHIQSHREVENYAAEFQFRRKATDRARNPRQKLKFKLLQARHLQNNIGSGFNRSSKTASCVRRRIFHYFYSLFPKYVARYRGVHIINVERLLCYLY